MDCKKIQELILTDYCDKEIDAGNEAFIRRHIDQCRLCKEFLRAVEKTAHEPFVHGQCKPPAYMWDRIQDALVDKKMQELEPRGSVLEKWKRVFSLRQPFLGWGTAFALVIMLAVTIQMNQPVRQGVASNKQEQLEYYAYVTNDTPDADSSVSVAGFGTPIEEYFL